MQVLSVLLEEFLEKVLICKSSSVKKNLSYDMNHIEMFGERSQGLKVNLTVPKVGSRSKVDDSSESLESTLTLMESLVLFRELAQDL